MEKLTKKGNLITFRNFEYIYVSTEKLDDNAIHLITDINVFYFIPTDTELNGKVYGNSDELINALNGIQI